MQMWSEKTEILLTDICRMWYNGPYAIKNFPNDEHPREMGGTLLGVNAAGIKKQEVLNKLRHTPELEIKHTRN